MCAAVQQGGDLIHALWSSAHIGSALVFCSVPILFNHRVRVCGGEQCICVCWVGIVCEARTDDNEEDGHLSLLQQARVVPGWQEEARLGSTKLNLRRNVAPVRKYQFNRCASVHRVCAHVLLRGVSLIADTSRARCI